MKSFHLQLISWTSSSSWRHFHSASSSGPYTSQTQKQTPESEMGAESLRAHVPSSPMHVRGSSSGARDDGSSCGAAPWMYLCLLAPSLSLSLSHARDLLLLLPSGFFLLKLCIIYRRTAAVTSHKRSWIEPIKICIWTIP